MSTTFDFSKKIVLVTGSTSGIGKATAELFLKSGATVAINGRSKERTAKQVKDFNDAKYPGKAVAVVGDVSTAEGVKAIIQEVDKLGELDVLVNNAGTGEVHNLETAPDSEWTQLYEGNVVSAVRLSRHYLPKFLKRKTGRIINISSIAALNPDPNLLAYSVSKAAMDGLTRALAQSTTGTEVTVNSVAVGPTDTEIVDKLVSTLAQQTGQAEVAIKASLEKGFQDKGWYLNRWIKPREVAQVFYFHSVLLLFGFLQVVAFLASQAGVLVNGASQRADGGTLRQF